MTDSNHWKDELIVEDELLSDLDAEEEDEDMEESKEEEDPEGGP